MQNVTVQTKQTRFGGVIYHAEATDSAALEDWFKCLCEEYHPCGYGTMSKGCVFLPGGRVRMTAWRAASCD